MGMMDKFLNAMRLNTDDDEEYYDDDYYDEDEPEYDEPPRQRRSRREEKADDAEETPSRFSSQKESRTKNSSKVTPMRPSRKSSSGGAAMEVCVFKPTSVEDAREITETLLDNRSVVLNLEGIDLEVGQRIIDFTSGSCYAINGKLRKISNYIFIITPANVDISGDFLDMMGAMESSSLQTDI